MGKTAFVLSMARNIAVDTKAAVAIFLEMSSVQLITRLISSETGLSSENFVKENLKTTNGNNYMLKSRKLKKHLYLLMIHLRYQYLI